MLGEGTLALAGEATFASGAAFAGERCCGLASRDAAFALAAGGASCPLFESGVAAFAFALAWEAGAGDLLSALCALGGDSASSRGFGALFVAGLLPAVLGFAFASAFGLGEGGRAASALGFGEGGERSPPPVAFGLGDADGGLPVGLSGVEGGAFAFAAFSSPD